MLPISEPLNAKGKIMQILKIDHLGIAVNSMEDGKSFWTDVLGLDFAGDEVVAEQKVNTGFFPVGESEVELLESTAPDTVRWLSSSRRREPDSSMSPFGCPTSTRRLPS